LELKWKVHFEVAQIEERAAELAAVGVHRRTGLYLALARDSLLKRARVAYVRSFLDCPNILRWKVWLAGSRLELSAGRIEEVYKLLKLAFAAVPDKSLAHVYLEASRVEEYLGKIDIARKLLRKARGEVRGEWKVYLESILIEARTGDLRGAVAEAEQALAVHPGTGRLWAILVQLTHRIASVQLTPELKKRWQEMWFTVNRHQTETVTDKVASEERAMVKVNLDDMPETRSALCILESDFASLKYAMEQTVLRRALGAVPKSGEVWCEGARVHLNPFLIHSFDLSKAQRYLDFAIKFTPQYGDTFIEYLRVELLVQVVLPVVLGKLGIAVEPFLRRFLCADPEADTSILVKDDRLSLGLLDASPREVGIARDERKVFVRQLLRLQADFTSAVCSFQDIVMDSLLRR